MEWSEPIMREQVLKSMAKGTKTLPSTLTQCEFCKRLKFFFKCGDSWINIMGKYQST